MLRFGGFLAGFWFVLHFRLRNSKERLHRSRELLQRRLAFGWLRLHDFILARILSIRSHIFWACIHTRRSQEHSMHGGFPGLQRWYFVSPMRMNFGSGAPLPAGLKCSSKYQCAFRATRLPSKGSRSSNSCVHRTIVPVRSGKGGFTGFGFFGFALYLPVK